MEARWVKTGELNYRKVLFGLVGLLLIVPVGILQDLIVLEGFQVTLYVIPSCLVLLLASFASDHHGRHFVQVSLAQEAEDHWKFCIDCCNLQQLCRPRAVQPLDQLNELHSSQSNSLPLSQIMSRAACESDSSTPQPQHLFTAT